MNELPTEGAPVTREMQAEAAGAGLYRSTWEGKTYPRIQIMTAGEIVHGKRIEMPSLRGGSGFTRAPVSRERAARPRLF